MQGHPPVNPKFPFFLHGGDYNPDQWRHVPGVLDEDFRLLPLAGVNSLSVGIFSWTALEPEEGRYEFGWLDDVMDRAAKQGMAVVLATPSGAKPNWMAAKYPEIRRMHPAGGGFAPAVRDLQGERHNHCLTSPVYRAKVAEIDAKLAERYAGHPALALWHVSNEFNGECRCPLCLAAFRDWLKAKYGDLDALNRAWWTGFWSHTYTDWSQIEAIDGSVDGLLVDWKRFVTAQTASFIRNEVQALRRFSRDTPVTANLIGVYPSLEYTLDFWTLSKEIDVVSWDNYPQYHERPGQTEIAAATDGFAHDLYRSLKGGRPYLMMESSPGPTNWFRCNRLLRPGQHRMKSLQAVAHGSDSVQYFQMRAGRGGCEKFHAAVIGHEGSGKPRMFQEVAQVGRDLAALRPVLGGATAARVGIVFDWESNWHLAAAQGPLQELKDDPLSTAVRHYRPYWKRGIAVDILNGDSPLDGYGVVVAPALFMLREGFAERVERFVGAGGTFIATWLTGIVGETGLCFRGGFPGPLRRVLGVWAEETDYLYGDEKNSLEFREENPLGIVQSFETGMVCDVVRADTAETVAVYGRDFYAGSPALTVNRFGKGEAWYVASRGDDTFLDAFHGAIASRLQLPRALEADLPEGVTANVRENANGRFTFITNFASEERHVDVGPDVRRNLLDGGAEVSGIVTLPPFGVMALQ